MADGYHMSAEFKAGLKHVIEHSETTPELVAARVKNVLNGTGSPRGSVLTLLSQAEAVMLVAWFRDRNILEFKNAAYVASRLQYIHHQMERMDFRAYILLAPLLSDNDKMISWYAKANLFWPDSTVHRLNAVNPEEQELLDSFVASTPRFTQENANDHRSFHFFAYQAILALRGDWSQLEGRCLRILADPPEGDGKYLVDHQFYLALARGDQLAMEAALSVLTSPEVAVIRNDEFAFGLTRRLISTFGVIYAKIAWRHGYRLKVDTPFIPAEWLPVQALPVYSEPYEFMPRYPLP